MPNILSVKKLKAYYGVIVPDQRELVNNVNLSTIANFTRIIRLVLGLVY